jgi:hypothetical protein
MDVSGPHDASAIGVGALDRVGHDLTATQATARSRRKP